MIGRGVGYAAAEDALTHGRKLAQSPGESGRLTTETTYTLVQQQADLAPLLAALRETETVALDTEADSLHHYHEKICLLQLSATVGGEDRHWIVDPLAGLDLAPLLALLEERKLLIHGLDYDLRLLHRAYGTRPFRVFDTMLAAQILGREQIGLAALVEGACGVVLNKHGQRADWSVRPIPEKLLAYAVDDTRYLARLTAALRAELEEKQRLDWHRESCERALAAALVQRAEPKEDAWRIKGGGHLVGRPAAVLRELWQWRDTIAERLDRPPFKVANPEFLLQWATWIAENPEATMADLPETPHWLRGDRLDSFVRAMKQALTMPPEHWPGRPARTGGARATRQEEAILQKIVKLRDVKAVEIGIQPGVLAPRDALRAWVQQAPATREDLEARSPLMRWQTALLISAVWATLQGEEAEEENHSELGMTDSD